MQIPLTERIENLTNWFHHQNQRPLFGFTLGSYYPLPRYPNGARRIPDGVVRVDDIAVQDYLDDTDDLYSAHEQAGGDFIFSAAPFLGVPWLEAALGCDVLADRVSGSTRSRPPKTFGQNPVVPEFSEDNPWVAKMLEFIPALARRSAGRYPVGVTLMRGISDLLSALYGAQEFIYRMHDSPDEAHGGIDRLTDFWIAFGQCLLKHLPLFHGGTGSFLYSLWCPGKTIWMQEDAAALLSPALYEEFIYPAACRLAGAFEHTVIHLHPTRFILTSHLVRSGIDVIELHIDHDGPRAESLLGHYMTILPVKPLLIWGDLSDEDLEFVLTRLPHQGLAVNAVLSSPDQGAAMWERAMRLSKSHSG